MGDAQRYRASLERLLHALPPPNESQSIEDQARACLTLVLSPALQASGTPHPANPTRCPNCDQPTSSTRSPYCGAECREIAGFVRQFRSGVSEGTLLEPDRQVGIAQVFWRILGGGLPLRNALIEPKALARLMNKYDGKCDACGAPATTVDHIGSHCNRTSNLRPMCAQCCQTKPFGSPEVVKNAQPLLTELVERIGSETPLRPCDDAATWDWRAYVVKRPKP